MRTPAALLDTRTLLWVLGEPTRLSPEVLKIISLGETRMLVSSGTLFEISIKANIGKLKVPNEFFDRIFESGLERLPISDAHLAQYRNLPLHHRDPFDRLLIAQAMTENIPLLSCDREMGNYDISLIW